MDESKLNTVAHLRQFIAGNSEVKFSCAGSKSQERYAHISRVLKRLSYCQLNKTGRGVVLHYLRLTSGYSRAQLTRLVARWSANHLSNTPLVGQRRAPRTAFARKYTPKDLQLLIEVDQANQDVCGPAIVHLLKRAYTQYGDSRFERLQHLCVSHLYNLRKSAGYQTIRRSFTKTKTVCNPIGVRKKPHPQGRAGFIRIDSVHQGDQDGVKGVYHITSVDSVSQWHIEACVQGISEAYLLPVLESIIAQYPFKLISFHSDNGSEYINHRVAKLLNKLHIEQTKSRARQSNDNALVESKNHAIVRKHMGYAHIPQSYAGPINAFYEQTFNPWLNMHRPCMYPVHSINEKGKVIKRYPIKEVKTPLEKLADLHAQGLVKFKAGVTLQALQAKAALQTDLQAAKAMQRIKAALFASFAQKRA